MGKASRKLAETKFDEKLVLDKYLTAVAEVGYENKKASRSKAIA
ncbi:hypothetical protein ACFQT0_01585 [Hymenobacter humi]|uniref:Uncharacterized protein n=1 Tax=Hymenobacter humi TaxID=1411620 RepID=A0ABW2TZM4_9BACT